MRNPLPKGFSPNALSSPLTLTGVSVMPGLPLGLVLATLRRHAIPIFILGVVGAGTAYVYARTLPKFYTATSLVAVAGSSFAIPALQGALRAENSADPMPIVRTEMQAITSRDLVTRLVNELELARLPEFNSNLRPPTSISKLKMWVQSFLPTINSKSTTDYSDQSIVAAATSAIKIFQDNRSLAIEVGFVSESPELSAKAANTIVADYMAIRSTRQISANSGANEVLTNRVQQVRKDVAALEAKIQQLRSTNEIVMLPAGSVGQQQLGDLVTALAKAALDRGELEASYNRAVSLAGQGSSAALASVLSSPTIIQLREREAAASQRIAELSSRYGSSHPGVASAQSELTAAKNQVSQEIQRIISSLGTQVRVARQREDDIQQQLSETRRTTVESENIRAELKQLQDEVVSRQKLYQTLLEQVQQTSGQPASEHTPDVYVLSTAAPPIFPSSPNLKMAAGFGGIAGLTVGCLLALTRIHSVSRPVEPMGSRQQIANFIDSSLLRRAGTGAPLTTSDWAVFDTIASQWRMEGLPKQPKVTLVAGVTDDDVVGLLATALARAARHRGDTTLIIDANVARPFKNVGIPGLAQNLVAMLCGEEWPDPTVTGAYGIERYGALSPSPAATPGLSGPIFMNLLTQARETFDTVVLLGPPIGTTETENLARQADFILIVVSASVKHSNIATSGIGPFAFVQLTA